MMIGRGSKELLELVTRSTFAFGITNNSAYFFSFVFKTIFKNKNHRLQRDSNLDRRSRWQATTITTNHNYSPSAFQHLRRIFF